MRLKTHVQILLVFLSVNLSVQAQEASCWGNSRGDAMLTGVSRANLPDQPELLWNFNTG